MEKRIAFLFALFVFGFSFTARADEKTTMYKLGRVYVSDEDDSVKCLEGHTGFILENKECRASSGQGKKCKSDADCKSAYGSDDWYCSTASKRCMEQECKGASDLSCAEKYSHLRSCQPTGDGGFHCAITCTWDTDIADRGATSGVNPRYLVDLLIGSKRVWEASSPNSALLSYVTEHGLQPLYESTISYQLYTCRNGKVEKCFTEKYYHIGKRAYTDEYWDKVKDVGCLPCVLASGGTYGKGTHGSADEDFKNHGGTHPYVTYAKTELGHRYAKQVVPGSPYVNASGDNSFYGCGNETTLRNSDYLTRLNSNIPTDQIEFSDVKLSATLTNAGLENFDNVKDLGWSIMCRTNGVKPWRFSWGCSAKECDPGVIAGVKETILYYFSSLPAGMYYYTRGGQRTAAGTGPVFLCCPPLDGNSKYTGIPDKTLPCFYPG